MMPRRPVLLTLLVVALAFLLDTQTRSDTTRCAAPDSAYGTTAHSYQYVGPHAFRAYRSGFRHVDLHYRDVEMLWDSLNVDATVVWDSQALTTTLDNFAWALVDSVGANPFHAPYSKMHWLYEYFRDPTRASYTTLPGDDSTLVFGRDVENYEPLDRSHVDIYLWNKDARWYHNSPTDSILVSHGGTYPSWFAGGEEDLSTDHDLGEVLHENSLMAESPLGDRRLDASRTGWTHPDSVQCLRVAHEFRHGLPGVVEGGTMGEMLSAAAEAVAGNRTEEKKYAMGYTWPLTANGSSGVSGGPTCTNLRSFGQNYLGWSGFGAYLAYNFRGADTTATLPGMQDDLLHKWATQTEPTLASLRDLLGDDSCGTCADLAYFHPGGVALDDTLRLALLLHNWRVANFVNNPALDQRQYGYQVDSLFSAAARLNAWYANGPGACAGEGNADSLIIVPPEVTLKAEHATRDTVLRGFRANASTTYPLVLQPLGSEYWVIRSDETSQVEGQDLVITVHVDSLGLFGNRFSCTEGAVSARGGGRLFASAIGYSEQAINGTVQPLWAHPAWATRVIEPQWTDVDTSGSVSLRLVVPDFGDDVKAVVVVLSMADGRQQTYSTTSSLSQYEEVASYRLQLGLRRPPFAAENPEQLDWLYDYRRWAPSWSPDNDRVVFTEEAGATKDIYITSVGSHSVSRLIPGAHLPQDHPDWSPRGDWVAYDEPAMVGCPWPDIKLHNTVSSETRTLTWHGCSEGAAEAPAFSPNGQQVAYTLHLLTPPAFTDGPWQLRRVDLSGVNDSVLVQWDSSRPIRSPRWSPDGQWIHFTAGDTLYEAKTDGSSWRPVVWRGDTIASTRTFDFHRGVGPMAFEQADCVEYSAHCFPLSTFRVVGRPFRRIALRDTLQRWPLPQFEQRYATASAPRWSYDGTRIAYVSDANAIGTASDIYVGQVSWNHAPQFVNAPRDTLLAAACSGAQTLTQTCSATDPDGEAVTFSAAYLPTGATLSSTSGEFSWPDPGPPGSEHYVVIRALDGSGGVAQQVIRIAIEPDSLRPAAAEAVVETGRTSATVGWVATGDDSLTGTACVSRVAYSTSPITEGNFFACSTLTTNPPGESGTLECALAPNGTLSSCTWYYFAVKTQDDAGRWSALSNVVQAKTTCSGTKIVECYAGDLMAQGGGEEGWELENSVLDLATTTAAATDVYALETRVAPTAAQARVRLTFRGSGSFALDQARLAVVDHPADVQVIASGNRVLQGTLAPVSGIVGEPGTALAAVIDSSEDARVVAAGTTWEVTLAGKATTEQALLIELAGWGAVKDGAGVEVQVPFLEGNWRTLAWLHPRAAAYAFVVDSLGGNQVRLVFRQECAVKRLAGLTAARTARLEPLAPSSAVHSTKGEAAEAVRASDEATLSLGKGESVVLTYELPVAKAELKRETYLLLGGSRVASRVQATSLRANGESVAGAVEAVRLPTAFALHQNQPNPVTGMTTVRFDLPRPARVRLEVFDLQGRRIARLVEGALPAGFHHTEWDGRGSGGNRVGAGVYLCRLQAGDFQAQRKMIVVR